MRNPCRLKLTFHILDFLGKGFDLILVSLGRDEYVWFKLVQFLLVFHILLQFLNERLGFLLLFWHFNLLLNASFMVDGIDTNVLKVTLLSLIYLRFLLNKWRKISLCFRLNIVVTFLNRRFFEVIKVVSGPITKLSF